MRTERAPGVDLEKRLAPVIAQARESREPAAVCARTAAGFRLEIWGPLPASWSASLSLHCTEVGLNIESGLGCRISRSSWAARFEVSSPRRMDVHAFDFLRTARAQPARAVATTMPSLDSFELKGSPGSGLAASVRGPDQPGFLASILQRFALFGLHPDRFVLGSVGDRALDAFLLKTIGGADPSPACVAALRSALTACLVGRPGPSDGA